MADSETAHRWYKIVYSKGGESPNFEENVQGTSAEDAIQILRYDREKVGQKIKILYVWQNLLPSEYEEKPEWERNVQFMRLEFPQLTDDAQDKVAIELGKEIEELLNKKLAPMLLRKRHFVVSLGGFYRGDHNWDNIDQRGSCVNYPDRGEGDNEP